MQALVVEDEIIIAIGLKAILESMNFDNVTIAGTLKELETLDDKQFELAIFDANLPDGCGRVAAEQFSEGGTPTIMHSGHITMDQVNPHENLLFLPKPSTRAKIKATIKYALGMD